MDREMPSLLRESLENQTPSPSQKIALKIALLRKTTSVTHMVSDSPSKISRAIERFQKHTKIVLTILCLLWTAKMVSNSTPMSTVSKNLKTHTTPVEIWTSASLRIS
jgi:hypothetical protein